MLKRKNIYFGVCLMMMKILISIDSKFVNFVFVTVFSTGQSTVFSEEVMIDFFDGIPTDVVNCDIFSLFGKITIVCCRNALFHFFYKEDLQHDKLSDECLGFDIDMRCMYMLGKKMFYSYLCSNCQFNFIKMISNRFITIKND